MRHALRFRGIAGVMAMLAIALLVTGCAQVTFFPRTESAGGGAILLARTTGKLVLDSGCLWLASGDHRDLLIWGPTYGVSSKDWHLEVTKDSSVVAVVGQEITVTGGEFTRGETQPPADLWIESQIGQVIPTACRLGSYWLVEAVVAASAGS